MNKLTNERTSENFSLPSGDRRLALRPFGGKRRRSDSIKDGGAFHLRGDVTGTTICGVGRSEGLLYGLDSFDLIVCECGTFIARQSWLGRIGSIEERHCRRYSGKVGGRRWPEGDKVVPSCRANSVWVANCQSDME